MEKIFIHSALFSTAILVVYALASPPQSLSAESVVQLDPETKVRRGMVTEINHATNTFKVEFEEASVPVLVSASTTVYSSHGDEVETSAVRDGSGVYVFGTYDTVTRSIEAEKIVIRNKSPMERKTLSRAEMQSMRKLERSGTNSILEELSLIAK